MTQRQIVLVSGSPAAGKTTLAVPLRTAHPAHPATEFNPAWIAELDQPVGLGAVIEVDTTQQVDIQALAAQVANLLDV